MVQEWLEVLSKRNRTSKTKRLHIDGQPTNKFSWDGQVGTPVHYKDAGAIWQDIKTELLPSTRSIVGFGNPAFEMVENEYEMFVLGALSSGVPIVRYVSKNTDYWVQFAAHNLQWTNDLDQISLIATPPTTATQISGDEAKWPNAYGTGRDIRYIAGAGRMQKWLDVVSPLPVPPQFIIDGGNPVVVYAEIVEVHLDLEVWVNGAKWDEKSEVGAATEIEFRSPDGQVQFVFPVAMGYHEGTAEDASIIGTLHLKKSGARLYITARFPLSWLQSATYPVHLDTTVDKQVAASADDCLVGDAGYSSFSLTNVNFLCGSPAAGTYYKSAARFLAINIPQGATINVAYLTLRCRYAGAVPLYTLLKAQDADDANTFSNQADFDTRTWTTGLDWDITVDWVVDTDYNSADFASKIQLVINRAGWVSGNDLAVLWQGDGYVSGKRLYGYSYDASATYAPKLHIEYTAGGTPYSLVVDAGSYAVAGTATDLLKDMFISPASGAYAITGVAVGLNRGLVMGAGVGSYALSGSAVDLPVDRVIGAGAGSYSLTGATVALLKDMLISAAAGGYTLTGTAVSLPIGRVISVAPGDYAIAGTAINLIKALLMSAGPGSYILTGAGVDFLRGKIMAAESGSYAITGSDVDLLKDLLIAIGAGSYALTGSDVGLHRGLIITASEGTYSISGTAVSLLLDWILSASPGTYVITGADVDLLKALIMAAGGGAYVLTGTDIAFLRGKIMAAASGSYAITGSDAGLLADLVMQALGGSYVITGKTANLILSTLVAAICSFEAKTRIFDFTAETREFGFVAKTRIFDFVAKEKCD